MNIPSKLYACPIGRTSRFSPPWDLSLWTLTAFASSGVNIYKTQVGSPPNYTAPKFYSPYLPIEFLEVWARYQWTNYWQVSLGYLFERFGIFDTGSNFWGIAYNRDSGPSSTIGKITTPSGTLAQTSAMLLNDSSRPLETTEVHIVIGRHLGGNIYDSVTIEAEHTVGIDGSVVTISGTALNVSIPGTVTPYLCRVGFEAGVNGSVANANVVINRVVIYSKSGLENICKGLIYADFSFAPAGGINQQLFVFTNASDAVQGISSYLWDFGDGTGSREANPTKLFGPGRHNVTLTVTGPDGTASVTKEVIVYGVDLSYVPDSGPVPLAVRFNSELTLP